MADSAIHPFQRSPTQGHTRASYPKAVEANPLVGGPALALAMHRRATDATLHTGVSPTQRPAHPPQVAASMAGRATERTRGAETDGAPVYLERILIRKARRMLLVRTADIELIEAAGNYVRINTADAQHLLRSPLTELASSLDPAHFLRIHRSAIVNTDFLESVETNPAGDYFVRLPSGRRLKCSRSYRSDLRLFLESFGS